jgi:hypothetical protein
MKGTKLIQEIRQMRFEETYQGWTQSRFTQEEAARLLGVTDRTFKRALAKYEKHGLPGLIDERLEHISDRCAPVDEVIALTTLYKTCYRGWNVKHFYSFCKRATAVFVLFGGKIPSTPSSRVQLHNGVKSAAIVHTIH